MRVLLADDEKTIRVTLADALSEAGHQVTAVADGLLALGEVESGRHDCLITDVRMPGLDGMALLSRVKAANPLFPVVVITAAADVESAVQAMKLGAETYIKKPFVDEEIIAHLKKVEDGLSVRRELVELRARLTAPGAGADFDGMVGLSPRMQQIFAKIDTVAGSDFTVLITGENGTGKDLIARSLHRRSARGNNCFLAVNCAALTETLVESELFGHVKGSFTSADRDHQGKFEAARGGTLFLDEIGEMPLPMQVKLLRVLETNQVTPVGSNATVDVDARLIAATNRVLEEEIEAGRFREYLFFRINVITIDVPPLRERPEDIPLLAQAFLKKYAPGVDYPLTEEMVIALMNYSWPGNVRELQNSVKRAIAMSGGAPTLRKEHLIQPAASRKSRQATTALDLRPLRDVTAEVEMRHIRAVLRYTTDKKAKAAEILGISRKRLWEKMKELGIEGEE
ncbi:MAG: sigma-54-dependent Fis family transcriptional regulator [Planctomycetes bacterium]|nr:sigma-54-dependent Fis family transcriptional regulator [Planctomycetota bacterium]